MKLLNIAWALIMLAQLLMVLHQFRRYRTLKQHQQRLVEALGGTRFWRVGMARPDFLKSWPKRGSQQALGVLIDEGDSIRLRGRWHGAQQDFEQTVRKDLVTLTWLTPHLFRTANLAWVQVQGLSEPLLVCADTPAHPKASREALADLLRSVFPGFSPPAGAATDFALEKNRAAVAAMAFFLTLLVASLLDTYVFNPYELIESQVASLLTDPVFESVAGVGLLGLAVVSYRRLRAGRVPVHESLALALFLTASLAMAALPMLKRVDQVLAKGVSQDYEYRVVDRVVHLSPVDDRQGLPSLRFTKAPEYWARISVGSTVQVPLLHGPLGLWQLDHQRFDPPILQFYENGGRQ